MTAEDLTDWIPVAEAARLIPPPRGKATAKSTIYDLINEARLSVCRREQGGKRGPRTWLYVRRSEVLALFQETTARPREKAPQVLTPAERAAHDRRVQEGLRRFGLA